ncbi:hypothetical protein CsSME_00044456 [Camellia sinensis var. sinensis]
MEQTNTKSFLSCLCFIFFFMNSLELITTAKGNPSLVLTNETDHQALLAIKDLITVDPLGALSSWNHSIHFCNWQGVSCGRRHQRVTLLNLSSLSLVGSVSPQIGNLTFLRTIDLRNNSFHGEIPQELGRLFHLQYLLLLNNSFQGEFPINLTHCSHLRLIDMGGNNLGGKIPTELGSLSNLSNLVLGDNHLTGTIPLSIGNLSNLRELSLVYNNLEGSIPTQLGQLSKLEFLQLPENNLSATNGISIHQQSSSIGIRGTIGYVAPEYGMGEQVSMQGDMYSYGVLLLEMFTGKAPTGNMFTGNVNLHSYVKMCLPKQVMQIVDPQIILGMEEEPGRSMQGSTTNISNLEACLVPVFQIGVSCSAEMSSERMSVKDVLKELHKIRNVFLGVRDKGIRMEEEMILN